MIECRGRVQREGKVIHVIADHLTDLSDLLRQVGERDTPARHDGQELGRKPRDIYVPDRNIRSDIKVRTRDFR